MESGFQTSWTAVDTGKSSRWFAARSLCCKNAGHVLSSFSGFLTLLQVCPPIEGWNGSVQCAIQLEIQGKRPFSDFSIY